MAAGRQVLQVDVLQAVAVDGAGGRPDALSSYARIERGPANPTWRSVSRIAGALGVTLAELGAAIDERRAS